MNQHVIDIDANMGIEDALSFFRKHRKGAYPVMHRKKLVGMVSEWDMVRQVRGRTGVKVSEAMVRKPIVVQETHSVSDVAKMLCVGGFRRLPVMNSGVLMGVVTPRDILRYLHSGGLLGKLPEQKFAVKRLLRAPPVTIESSRDVQEAAGIMISKKIGGLPVVDDNELVGIITERDIVDMLVA